MTQLTITGGEQFAALAKRLEAVSGADVRRELDAALVRSTPPLKRAAKASAAANLPHRGGLAGVVASAEMSTVAYGGGVRIVAHGIQQLALTNSGLVRHPVYGRNRWVTQSIPKARDWFFKPMRKGADKVRRELVKALDDIADKIA